MSFTAIPNLRKKGILENKTLLKKWEVTANKKRQI